MNFSPESLSHQDLWQLLQGHKAGFLVCDANQNLLHSNPAGLLLLNLDSVTGRNLKDLFGTLGGDSTDVHYQQKILRVRPMNTGGPWLWWVVFDVTEEQLALRRNRALVRLAARLTYAGSIQATLDEVAASVLKASEALAIAVIVLEGEELQAVGSAGLSNEYRLHLSQMIQENQLPEDIMVDFRARRPHIERDRRRQLLEDPRWEPVHEYLQSARWNSLSLYPMIVGPRNLGFVASYYADSEVGAEQLAFSQAVADLCAVAAENTRLLLESQQKAVLLDRQRIARELHDSVSQALYGIALGVETASSHLENQRWGPLQETLEYVASLDRVAQAEMRSLIFELRPEAMESEGLVGLIQRQLLTLEVRYKTEVVASLVEPDLSPPAKHHLYRIFQEAIHNIAKHAHASRVTVVMKQTADCIEITISDNGEGMTLPGHRPGHIGLQTMQERASQIGAKMETQSAPGQGTTLHLKIPT